jgi:hypothetical protein
MGENVFRETNKLSCCGLGRYSKSEEKPRRMTNTTPLF